MLVDVIFFRMFRHVVLICVQTTDVRDFSRTISAIDLVARMELAVWDLGIKVLRD